MKPVLVQFDFENSHLGMEKLIWEILLASQMAEKDYRKWFVNKKG